ncbi:MAG: TetR/AcrR family transcriptional regulator [Chloroflexota bacterium]|nr:TetR/AcrR family transcriptional regulator [Chloroflexota bacterium]
MTVQNADTSQIIIEKTVELFKKYGVHYVTMDLIAEQLGMSKKTLYVHFNNKRDLVWHAIETHLEGLGREIDKLYNESSNEVKTMLGMMNKIIDFINNQNPLLHEEMHRYYPEIAQQIDKHRWEENYEKMLRLVEKGKERNMFRQDVNSDIVAKLFLVDVNNITNTDLFPHDKYSKKELIKHVFVNFLRGIVTPKGLEILEQNEQLPE